MGYKLRKVCVPPLPQINTTESSPKVHMCVIYSLLYLPCHL